MLMCPKKEKQCLVRIRLSFTVNFEPFGNALTEAIVSFCAVP